MITTNDDPDTRRHAFAIEPNRLDVDLPTLIKKVEGLAIERGMAVGSDQ